MGGVNINGLVYSFAKEEFLNPSLRLANLISLFQGGSNSQVAEMLYMSMKLVITSYSFVIGDFSSSYLIKSGISSKVLGKTSLKIFKKDREFSRPGGRGGQGRSFSRSFQNCSEKNVPHVAKSLFI